MNRKSTDRMSHMIGLATDGVDGHVRVTSGDRFKVVMGSADTHDALSAWCARIDAALKAQGRSLDECSEAEFLDLVRGLEQDNQSPS